MHMGTWSRTIVVLSMSRQRTLAGVSITGWLFPAVEVAVVLGDEDIGGKGSGGSLTLVIYADSKRSTCVFPLPVLLPCMHHSSPDYTLSLAVFRGGGEGYYHW